MKLVLVSCYELGRPPLGIASPAAHLAAAGFETEVLDVAIEGFDPDRLAGAELVVIAVPMHTALRIGKEVADRTRALSPKATIVFVGYYAILNRDHLRSSGLADRILGGEYEDHLVELAVALRDGHTLPPDEAPTRGLTHRTPLRTGLPTLDRYSHVVIGDSTRLAGAVEASRGCLHLCRHCPIPPVYGGRFRAIDPAIVAADIDALVAAGARHISFADPDFLNGPTHALRIAQSLHEAHPGLTWDFTAKVNHLVTHANLLGEFVSAGCLFVISAVESVSPLVLERLEKGHTRADVEAAIGHCRAAGLCLRPTWVAFTPWTSITDYAEMLDFIATEDLVEAVDPVQYTVRLLIPPGSLLLSLGDPAIGPLVASDLAHPWNHPDPRVDDLHRRSLLLVEDALAKGLSSANIHTSLAAEVMALGGSAIARPRPAERPVPRMSEDWFC